MIGNVPFNDSSMPATKEKLTMKADQLIERDPEKMSGTPVFFGTRVPIKNLFDYLEGGDSLDEFLDDFPTVTREQALGVLEVYKEWLLADYETAA